MACVVFIHENIDGGFFLQEFELIAGYFYVQSKQKCWLNVIVLEAGWWETGPIFSSECLYITDFFFATGAAALLPAITNSVEGNI